MITTILFDADGVLIRGELASKYFERTYGIPYEKLLAFYRGPFVDCIVGKRDVYEVLPPFLDEWGWEKSSDAFIQEWFTYEHDVDQDLLRYIQELRTVGVHCYVATNQEQYRARHMLDNLGFGDNFDGLFASAHLGSAKPDIQFFEKILQKLHITDPASVLFWDDTPANVTAAKTLGLHAEIYTEFADFLHTMETKYKLQLNK